MSSANEDDIAIDRILHPGHDPNRPCHLVPDYTTKVADDFRVLEFVRNAWGSLARQEFTDYLNSKWAMRAHKENREVDRLIMYYQGDYSRAALHVAREQSIPGATP